MEWTGAATRDKTRATGNSYAGPLPPRLQAQHESISPLERSPTHVDEGMLLAEAEDLLATLDAAAFAARTPSLVDNKKSSWIGAHPQLHGGGCPVTPSDGPPLKRPTKETNMNQKTDDAGARAAADKMRPGSWRDRVKEEATQLRKVATKLEVQLLFMQQQSASSLSIRTKRVQIWQKLAERQLRMRQLAEAENLQLKAMLHEHLRGVEAQHLVQANQSATSDLAASMPNYLRGPWKEAIQPMRDAVMASVFEPMLHRLDTGYAELDAVFRENGMHKPSLEPRSFLERKTRRLGEPCQYVEIGDLRTLPFPWRAVGHHVWLCNREWHFKDKPYEYPCLDRSGDTFAVNYRVTHKSFGPSESANFKLVVRRYQEAQRLVIVYSCQSDGEKDLAGASTSDIGWLVISEAGAQEPSSVQPITTVQSCWHLVSSGADQDKVNRLVSLMMCAFEEDVVLMNQTIDNRLLEEARARSSNSLASVHQTPADEPLRELIDRTNQAHHSR